MITTKRIPSAYSFLIILLMGCVLTFGSLIYYSNNQNSATTVESGTPIIETTPTTPPTFNTLVTQLSFCHNGPNETYLGSIAISAKTEVEVLAIDTDGEWFMIRGAGIDPCWVMANTLTLSPNIDFTRLLVLTTIFTREATACRIDPNIESILQTVIPKNRKVVAYGKSNEEASWVLVVPHDSTTPCWVEKKTLSEFVHTSLPIESAELFLTLTTTSTTTNWPYFPSPSLTNTRRPNNDNPTPVPPGNTSTSPTNTSAVPPTNTFIVPPTSTSVPPPTNTQIPPPTNTSVPPPTNTQPPPPTPTLCWPPGHCR